MFIYNLEALAQKLKIDYDSVTSNINHNVVKGSAREDILKETLRNVLPKRYSISSGIIMDSNQSQSKQQDFIIYDSFNCPSFYETQSNKILPIESVYATIEVKSTLSKSVLQDCINNIRSVRSLYKQNSLLNIPLYPLGFVFAYSSEVSLETLQKDLYQLNKDIEPENQISIICVLDKGLLFNVNKSNICEYNVYPSKETLIGRSENQLKNNLYSFYLLLMQYLNSITIVTPNLIEYAKKSNAFNIGVEIPREIMPRDATFVKNYIKASYGDVLDMIAVSKKYPHLFNGKMQYSELRQFLENDFFPYMEKAFEITSEKISPSTDITLYGYKIDYEEFIDLKNTSQNLDNSKNLQKFEKWCEKIYRYYCVMINNKSNEIINS